MTFAREGIPFILIALGLAAIGFTAALMRRSWPLWLVAFVLTVLVIWVAVHAALGIIMLLYALARSLAGRMTPVHDGDVRNVTVYQHFFALSAVTTFPVIAFFPGLG